MPNHLKFLQTLSERELTELVIIPLLEKLGYREIRYTHGPGERGKDIVFAREDHLTGPQHLAAAVKCRPLSGSVSDSKSIHEVLFQLQQAVREPYILPLKGEAVFLEQAFCITPYAIAPTTIDSVREQLRDNATKVRFIDGPKLLSLIEEHLPDLLVSLPNPESRYLHNLCTRFLRATPMGHLGESQRLTPHDLYISSSISSIDFDGARFLSFATPSEQESPRLSLTRLLTEKHAVVIADVGTGKTTAMQRLVIECVKGGSASDLILPLPIFIPLLYFQKADVASAKTFETSLHGFIKDHYGFDISSSRTSASGKYLFLLDGFDELVAQHDVVAQTASDLSIKHGHNVIVTSRPSRIPKLPGFRFYKLNQFTDENVLEFLEKWFGENNSKASKVYDQIQSNPPLVDLCRTALMLTLYAILATQGDAEALPTRRTDVYRLVVEMLLGRWDSSKNIRNSFTADTKHQVLEAISYSSHIRQQRWLYGPDLIAIIDEILRSRRGRSYAPNEAKGLFEEIIFRSSLLRPDERGVGFEFVHLSFQEYFVACALLRKGSGEVIRLIDDDWWRNSLRFYFGISRSLDSILGSIRTKKVGRGYGLRLLEFLSEADYTAPEGRKRVLQLVSQDIVRTSITKNELAIYRRLGDDVVEALDSITQDPPKVWSSWNFFRVLLEIRTQKSRALLVSSSKFLATLTAKEMIEVIYLYLDRVSVQETEEFLLATLRQIHAPQQRLSEREWPSVSKKVDKIIERLKLLLDTRIFGKRHHEFWKEIDKFVEMCDDLANAWYSRP